MEYRGIQYSVAEDDRGWQWTVFPGNPETAQSEPRLGQGTAILKVWAEIDLTLGPNKRRLARLARSKA
jgi:hypothetical protein